MPVNYNTEYELQRAIYKQLTADVDLMSILSTGGGVVDWVPATAPAGGQTKMPYVTIGDMTSNEWDSKSEVGEDMTVTLHIWSDRHAGKRQVKIIQGHLKRLLHDQILPIEGHTNVLARREFVTSMLDPDGLTTHGIARYRYIVQSV